MPPTEPHAVDLGALEATMDEVVEALDLTERAAEFVQTTSDDARQRERAAQIRRQAEAMLGAAEERRPSRPEDHDERLVMH